MLPLWLIEVNYYIAFLAGFFGNTVVIVLSLKTTDKEIYAYRWVISFQALIEASICLMTILLKIVSFFDKCNANHFYKIQNHFATCLSKRLSINLVQEAGISCIRYNIRCLFMMEVKLRKTEKSTRLVYFTQI